MANILDRFSLFVDQKFMTASDLIDLLSLSPLPLEGGFYRETYRSAHSTAIYYLLTSDTFSAMHRLRDDEVYHVYLGDPVELLQLEPGGASRVVTLGADLAAGQQVQHVVPAGVWQGSRLATGGAMALLGTTMAPGFAFEGFELGERAALIDGWPDRRRQIEALTARS